MQFTPELLVSLIGIVMTAIVGVILKTQINAKNSSIEDLNKIITSMKSLNELYNFDKLKSYKDIIEKEAEGRYKLKFAEQVRSLNEAATTEAAKQYINDNADFLESYEEMLSIPVNIMRSMSSEDREEHLKFYPKNADLLRSFLKAIDEGKVDPDSSISKNESDIK